MSRQAAIVRGAALRGLESIVPARRRCRRHYGFSVAERFRQGIDPEYESYICPFDGKKYCGNRIDWAIEKV